jgi:hypothetical protein
MGADVGSVRSGGATSRNIESGGRSQGPGGTSSARLQSNRDRESDLMGTGVQFRGGEVQRDPRQHQEQS